MDRRSHDLGQRGVWQGDPEEQYLGMDDLHGSWGASQVRIVRTAFPQKCCPARGHVQDIGAYSAFLLGSQCCCQDGREHLKTVFHREGKEAFVSLMGKLHPVS